MRARLWCGVMAAALAAGMVVGCEPRSCTLAACLGLVIEFSRPLWQLGTYELTLEADGKTTTCSYRLGEDSEGVPRMQDENCDKGLELDSVWLGYGTSAQQVVVEGVRPAGTPARLSLTLEHDGVLLVEQQFSPEYATYRDFNGPGCGDCTTARVTMNTSDVIPEPPDIAAAGAGGAAGGAGGNGGAGGAGNQAKDGGSAGQ